MDRRVIRNALLAAVMVVLLAVVSPRVGYAEPDEQTEPDSFLLLVQALRYAEEKRIFVHADSPLVPLTEWFIDEVVNSNIPSSQEQTRDKERLLRNIQYQHPSWELEETLVYLRRYDLLSSTIIEVLTDWYIEKIAEYTDDTPDAVRALLTIRVAEEMRDRAALVALYKATYGENWGYNRNWLSNLPLDHWYGVSTTARRVRSLDLSDNGLTGEIPPEIGNLPGLLYLDLRDNGLTGEIPPEIGSLSGLLHLWLGYNGLTGEIPPEIGNLSELSHLHLGSNELIGEIPPEIGNLSELVYLVLSDNGLTGEIPPEIGNLSELSRLYLGGNDLTGEIPPEIGNLSELSYLYLGDNGLTGEIPPEIGNLSELVYLILNNNGLTGEIPPDIGNLSKLSDLSLSNNDLHGQIPMELENLSNLEWFDINGNRFTGCIPDSLYDLQFDNTYILPPSSNFFYLPPCTQMSALAALYEATDGDNWTDNTDWLSDKPIGEWYGVTTNEFDDVVRLELDDNNLSGRIPAEVGNLSSLEYLSLFGNRLSGDIPAELGRLSNLEYLFLGGNRIGGCLPDGLSYVPRIDISALGVPFCGSGSDAPAPSLALAAFSPSPTKVNLFWLNGLEAEAVTIYRDGMPVATPPLDLLHYTDSGLSSNVRYEYRIEANLADGSAEAAEASVVTLAHPPRMVELMDVNESGFTLVIVDESNPPGTEYRITLNDISGENKVASDWNASRCVTFEGLQPGISYSFEAVAGNLDGIESEPGDWIYDDYDHWPVQAQPGNDDPWAIYKINGAAGVYGLTEAAHRWMLSDIRVKFYRNEPGYAGYSPREPVAGVGNVPMGAFIHEVMHGFTHHWTGFPQPCDVMNIHTFKRDVARFLLDFRDYDQSGRQNPLEDWRPFYNTLVSLRGEDFWELLQRGDYHELDALYHFTDADIPSAIAGKLSLLPPTLRPQFDGFIAESVDTTTWREELYWYSSLPPQEMRLWDTAYNYHGVLHHSPQYAAPPSAPRTNIPAQKRELLRNSDRRVLVDFVNTLEDISCNLQVPCKELWNSDFDFWTGYVHRNLYRARLYLEELSAGAGIELAPDNLDAVRGILRPMVSGVSCDGASNPSTLRWRINSETAISDLQRNALLAMVDVLERHPDWRLPCDSDAALAEAWSDVSPRGFIHSHSTPVGGTD